MYWQHNMVRLENVLKKQNKQLPCAILARNQLKAGCSQLKPWKTWAAEHKISFHGIFKKIEISVSTTRKIISVWKWHFPIIQFQILNFSILHSYHWLPLNARGDCKQPCFDQLHAHILERQQNSKRSKMCAFSWSKHGCLQSPLA